MEFITCIKHEVAIKLGAKSLAEEVVTKPLMDMLGETSIHAELTQKIQSEVCVTVLF